MKGKYNMLKISILSIVCFLALGIAVTRADDSDSNKTVQLSFELGTILINDSGSDALQVSAEHVANVSKERE
jgi:hypothetical protein